MKLRSARALHAVRWPLAPIGLEVGGDRWMPVPRGVDWHRKLLSLCEIPVDGRQNAFTSRGGQCSAWTEVSLHVHNDQRPMFSGFGLLIHAVSSCRTCHTRTRYDLALWPRRSTARCARRRAGIPERD